MSTLPVVSRQRVCGRLGCGSILLIGGPAKADEPLNMTVQCHACGWHYTLGLPEQGPPPQTPLQPTMASSHGVATPTVQVSKCVGINNKRCNKNAHGFCTRRCCRSCCVGMGGCRGVKGHSETHLSERQRMKARVQNTSIQQQQPSHVVRYQPLAAPPTTSTSIHGPSPGYFGESARILLNMHPHIVFMDHIRFEVLLNILLRSMMRGRK